MAPRLRLALLVLLTAVPVAVAGCASAERAYHGGMEAEMEGDYDAAARGYVTALRRDASLPNVRGRLAIASREAIRAHLAAAAAAPDPVARAEAWLAADALAADAASVGVTAERPPTFDAERDAALDDAVYALLADAASAVDDRRYDAAVARLDAAARFRPSALRRGEIDATRRAALAYWAEDDLAAGRFRAALARADAALAVDADGRDESPATALRDLRARILDAGARHVVVMPALDDAEAYPSATLDAVDDAAEHAAAGTAFMRVAEPSVVRRLLRDRTAPRSPLARAEWLADMMDAEVAVVLRLDPPTAVERPRSRPVRVEARRRGGTRDTTSYLRQEIDVRMDATVQVTALAPGRRTPLCSERADASATERIARATYDGDWRALDLSASARALFEPDDRRRAERRALERLTDDLATRAAQRLRACLGGLVP